jgi:hypothetical protein
MLLSLWLAVAPSFAMPPVQSGRAAIGVSGSVGLAPVAPSYDRQLGPAGVGCASGSGWWLFGGHTFAGPKGAPTRADDTWRIGGEGSICPLSQGGQSGGVGFGLGRQWGGHVYLTSYAHVGVSAFAQRGPGGGDHYTAFAPYVSPTVALGATLMPGFSVEVGPYAWFAPPVLQVVEGRPPAGMFLGHAGLEATVLFGNASPRAFGNGGKAPY